MKNNKIKFQGFSANIYFFIIIIVLYFSEEFIVMSIYIIFALLYFISDFKLYSLLYKMQGRGKNFVLISLYLLFLNSISTFFVNIFDIEPLKLLAILHIIISLWFNVFYSVKVYLEYRLIIDEYYLEKQKSIF